MNKDVFLSIQSDELVWSCGLDFDEVAVNMNE